MSVLNAIIAMCPTPTKVEGVFHHHTSDLVQTTNVDDRSALALPIDLALDDEDRKAE